MTFSRHSWLEQREEIMDSPGLAPQWDLRHKEFNERMEIGDPATGKTGIRYMVEAIYAPTDTNPKGTVMVVQLEPLEEIRSGVTPAWIGCEFVDLNDE